MPFSGLGVRLGAKAALTGAAFLGRRLWKKSRAYTKTKLRKRSVARPSAGMRPWVFPKLTMQRGVDKDFVFCFDGSLVTPTTQREFGVEDVFNMNSCFKPAVGGATGQPLYWDQYEALYQRYRVHACTVEVRWMKIDDATIVACSSKVGASEDTVKIEERRQRMSQRCR